MSDQGSGDMSRTLLGGSEEDYAVVCDPCKFDNQHVEAKAYCSNCNENLCAACIKFHGKMAGLRDHVIETEVRSQSRKLKARRPAASADNDPLTDTCEQHQQEIVKFYCNTHNALGCGVCLPFDHKNCTDVSYIRDVSGDVANSEELNGVRSEIKQAAARLKFSKASIDNTKERIAQRYKQTLEEVGEFEEEVINYVHEIADDARQEATRLRDESLKESDDQVATCTELVQETEQMTTAMDTRIKAGLNNGLYVAMKRAKAKLPDLQMKTKQFSDVAPRRFVFNREGNLQDVLASTIGLGKVTMTNTPRVAEHVQDLNVSSDRDTDMCTITGIAAITGYRLAIVDNKNEALKVVDIKQRKITDEVPTSSVPISITLFEEDTVAITLRGKREIQIYSVSPTLTKRRVIQVKHLYSGIAYASGRFALTPQSAEQDKRIHICDVSGQLVMAIETTLQDASCHVTFIPTQEVICVSHFECNTIVYFDMSGTIISTYSHNDLKSPTGISVDEDGCVYVCCKSGHCIHQMSPGAASGTSILTKKHDIDYPWAITFNGDYMYTSSISRGQNFGNFIKIFKMC